MRPNTQCFSSPLDVSESMVIINEGLAEHPNAPPPRPSGARKDPLSPAPLLLPPALPLAKRAPLSPPPPVCGKPVPILATKQAA